MADRLLVDLGGDGQATVQVWPEGGLPELVARAPLAWPLDGDALEDLRWYLEDYLLAPFGVWEQRGPAIQGRLAGWGEQVFGSLFGGGPARDAYQRARDRGLELVFRSPAPGLLGLPWELMTGPDGPVALRLAGVSRALPVADLAATAAVAGGRLRVLMVISRPAGIKDVGYQMVARPLLGRLQGVRGQVDLVVLRPPTLKALQSTLAEAAAAGHPFQVVHFDGHGVMPDRAGGGGAMGGRPAMMTAPALEGVLAFEKPGGGSEAVTASQFAAVLRDAKVPVVVLNACQSGAVGKDLEASVATALLRAGCAAVVAMAYSVYAVAAAEFMAVFYERLFAGDTLSAAVTAGRRRLFEHDGRPSLKGDLPLADWLVPVHYLRRDVAFPQARIPRPVGAPSLDALLNEQRTPTVAGAGGAGELNPAGEVFVGRDDLLYQLESAARLQRVVVLSGPGGTGKTELAKGFARWWRDTGGVDDPRLVCWHSFEPGVASFGLDGVLNTVGLAVFGADFGRLDAAQRLETVKQLLAQYRALLVWDNFETVREMPDPTGATPPLDDPGCAQLREFTAWVRDHSKSAVIITSRASESWLGQVRRITVGGLNRQEAAEYAGHLLAPYPNAQRRRERRSFGELLDWLDGHPLAMRLTLPRLDTDYPRDLLTGLQGTSPLSAEEDAGLGRLSSLGACITYSFSHLAEQTRQLLPAVSLFHSVADADVLTAFSAVEGVPARFAGVNREQWRVVLEDSARVGLLTSLGAGMYQIHPALPGYLAAGWQAQDPVGYGQQREACEQALCTASAHFSRWLTGQIDSGNAAMAYAIIGLQRRTMSAMLGHALDRHAWAEAGAIVRALDAYWDTRGLDQEAAAWADRILKAATGPAQDMPTAGSLAESLWLYTTIRQADGQRRAGQLNKAEHSYQQVLTHAQRQPETERTRNIIAGMYLQLGTTAQGRGRLDEAADRYRKSLTIFDELGDRPNMAVTCHQLGVNAGDRMRLDEAEDWYRKALTIKEELGDQPGVATTYHQLGITAHRRGRLDEAEDWYRKSLAIHEELGDRPSVAKAYHQLGMTAQGRGRLDEAEGWYRKSLTIKEELGNRPSMAMTYGQLGLLAEARQQPGQALDWMVRCVTLFDQFPDPATGPGPRNLARLTRQLGMPALEHTWQQVTGQPLPQAVRDYVTSHPDEDPPGASRDRPGG